MATFLLGSGGFCAYAQMPRIIELNQFFDYLTESHDYTLPHQDVTVYGGSTDDNFTRDSAIVTGDFNGDGIDDIAVGAVGGDGAEEGTPDGGEAYIFYGAVGLYPVLGVSTISDEEINDMETSTEDVTIFGATIGDALTRDGAMAVGDFNNDGIDDLVLGAPNADGPSQSRFGAGEVYIIFGSKTLPEVIDLNTSAEDVTIYGATASDQLTFEGIIAIGDFNNDDFDDLVLSAPRADGIDGTKSNSGEVYIIFGSDSMPEIIDLDASGQDVTIYGATGFDFLTTTGAHAVGDFNRDGFDDLVVGTPMADGIAGGRPGSGEAYIIFGSDSMLNSYDLATSAEDVTIFGAKAGDRLTDSGALIIGDFNGDGFDDLALGASEGGRASEGRAQAGEAYIIFGSDAMPGTFDLLAGAQDVTIYGATADDKLTASGAMAVGDINGDGTDDLILAAPNGDSLNEAARDVGEVYIIFGSTALPSTFDLNTSDEDVIIYGVSDLDRLTQNAGIVIGDFDRDGHDDLVLSTIRGNRIPGFHRAGSGEAYIVFGSATMPIEIFLTPLCIKNYELVYCFPDYPPENVVTIFGADEGDELTLGGAMAVLDFNGDGTDDLVLGTWKGDGQSAAPYDRPSSGELYAIFGVIVPPTVEEIVPSTTGPTMLDSILFEVTFSEAVSNFDTESDLIISHDGTAHSSVMITQGPIVYLVSFSGVSGDGSFTLAVNSGSDILDASGFPVESSITSVAVIIDNTPPVITLSDPHLNTVEFGSTWFEPGVMAIDNIDSVVPVIISGDIVNPFTSLETLFVLDYDATDTAGNVAIRLSRNLRLVDTTPPTITLNSPGLTVVEIGGTWMEPGATAFDIEAGDVAVTIGGETVNPNDPEGTVFTVTYDAVDSVGNHADQVIRSVTVVNTTPPILDVFPSDRRVTSSGGETSFSIDNIGSTTLNWSAEITQGAAWLAFSSSNSGADSGSISLTYETNNPLTSREGIIVVSSTSPDVVGSPIEVRVIQSGRELNVVPESHEVPVEAGTRTFEIQNLGVASLDWQAVVISGQSWLEISSSTSGSGDAVLEVNFDASRESTSRIGTISVTADGVTGASFVSIIQAGYDPPILEVSPRERFIGTLAGEVSFSVSNIGVGTLEWSAEIVSNSPWLRFSSDSFGVGPADVVLEYDATILNNTRMATVRFTEENGLGLSVDVEVFQSGEFDLCVAWGEVLTQYAEFVEDFNLDTTDFDRDLLPEVAALTMINAVVCFGPDSAMRDATIETFENNLFTLENEPSVDDLIPYRAAIAALMTIGAETQSAVKTALGTQSVFLQRNYVSVLCFGTQLCLPGNRKLDQGTGVFIESAPHQKNENEPYSATGDPDFDNLTNKQEYDSVMASGGSLADFVFAALGIDIGGTGGGDCSSSIGIARHFSSPRNSFLGDLALMLGLMLALQIRRKQGSKPLKR